MPEETVNSPETMADAFHKAAGITPDPVEAKPAVQEPTEVKSEDPTPLQTSEETVPKETVVDWEKRFKDTQSDHDKLLAENKKFKEKDDTTLKTLQTFRESLASAETLDDVHNAVAVAEKAEGRITFDGLDPRSASVIAGPINDMVAQMKARIDDMENKVLSQEKTRQMETEYPYLREHKDTIAEAIQPIIAEFQNNDDGDRLAMALVNKGFELAQNLKGVEATNKGIAAAQNTPASADTQRVTEPAPPATQGDADRAIVSDVFKAGSVKGRVTY